MSQLTLRPWEYRELEPDNPYYPLSAGYEGMTPEEQQKDRLRAVRRQRTPLEFTAAWDAFRRLYLMTTEPGFFYHNFRPSPPFHYEMIHDVGKYGRNVCAAPRGFSKSIVIGTELALFLGLTRPNIRIVIGMATDKLIEKRFELLAKQLTENPYLLADFGPQKPPRGQGIWNKHQLTLANGSRIEGFSVTGRKRGARPDLFILDDPEYDDTPNSETSGLISREKFENFLFQQVIPMLEKGSGIVWIGTVIGRQSFLSYALTAGDPRFEYWNKRHYRAGDPDAQDPARRELLWEANWDAETLRIRKAEIGPEAYAREYMNETGTVTERVFTLDPVKNYYLVEQPDEVYLQNPLQSTAKIVVFKLYPDKGWRWLRQEVEARKLFASLFILLTVDSARTVTRHSDYSCVMVTGFDSENCLWVLDLWLGRCPKEQLLNHIFRLGYKWQARVIGVESCGTQIEIFESCKTMLEERRISGWEPRVAPVDYQMTSDRVKKGQRIGTLEWRFNRGKLKLPAHCLEEWPWNQLTAQINDFTYDLAMLAYDDAVDTLAMTHYVVHGRGANEIPPPPRRTLAQRFAAGDVYVAGTGGVPRISGMNACELTEDLLQGLLARAYHLGQHGRPPDPAVKKPYVVNRPFPLSGTGRGGRKDYSRGRDTVLSFGGTLCPIHPNLGSFGGLPGQIVDPDAAHGAGPRGE